MHTLEGAQLWADEHIEKCKSPETAMSFIEELSAECLEYGAQCMQGIETDGKIFDAKLDAAIYMIQSGHTMWSNIVEYCKNKYNITIFPYGFLMICKNVNTGDTLSNQLIHDATEVCIQKAERTDKTDKHYLDQYELTQVLEEYFSLLNELGTFYHNRENYKTESDRKKYDRVVTLYKILIQDN